MFTGIIDHCGEILKIVRQENTLTAWIKCQFTDLVEGESIAVDGVCLTATEPKSQEFRCAISPESCQITTAQGYKAGQRVNLERALRFSDRIGGHLVMGHVDQKCQIAKIVPIKEFLEITFTGILSETQRFFIKKGSVAVNGVSLTINEVLPNGFTVMLIPHTLKKTNLDLLKTGDEVNIEYDWLTKVIAQQVQAQIDLLPNCH